MFTNRRLTNAYLSAKKVDINNKSKIVFFSDCHRGDDSVSDEFARNQTIVVSALRYYYKEGYTYVEAGDGDELFEYGNFRNIRSAHIDVFTVLKEFYRKNRFYMIYGNHNIFLKYKYYVKNNYYYYFDEYKDKRRKLFPGLVPYEGIVFENVDTGQEIFTIHGHQGDFMNDQLWFVSMVLLRYFWRFMHVVGFKNPASPARNQFKQHKIEKNYCKWLKDHKVMLICGHTHRLKFPKEGELPYFNIGCCVHTKGVTALEIVDGKIMIVQWRVSADEDGSLKIRRMVIRGPERMEHYK